GARLRARCRAFRHDARSHLCGDRTRKRLNPTLSLRRPPSSISDLPSPAPRLRLFPTLRSQPSALRPYMPKDTSIKRILVIGSGPIVIGQGCEFDYSGVQACKALREEGYEVVLINSNPA